MPRGKNQQPSRGEATIPPQLGIEFLSEQITKANEMLANQPVGEQAYNSWHNTTRNLVEKAFGENHPNIHSFEFTWGSTNYTWTPAQWDHHRALALQDGVQALKGYIEELKMEVRIKQPVSKVQTRRQSELSNKVFIVHGHDGELKEAAARLVTKLGLEPVILHEQPNKGRTIVEKFSDHAQEVGFAVVLLSADDEGKSRASSEPPKLRARQNVVFELGFFFAQLGPYLAVVAEPLIKRFNRMIHEVAPIIKSQGFAEEKEWRAVSAPILSSRLKVRPEGGLLKPYFEVPLKLQSANVRVVVGPNPHMELATDPCGILVANKYPQSTSIECSSISFRSL